MQLSDYQINGVTGFLPAQDPLQSLPPDFAVWEQTGAQVSALLMAGRLRSVLESLPVLDANQLQVTRQLNRAMLLLSVLGNAFVWGDAVPALRIPCGVAIPLWQVADRLSIPPIVGHAHMVLHNWRRLAIEQPMALDNLAPLQLFLGGLDEQWFYMVTVAIEAEGGPAVEALVSAQAGATQGDVGIAVKALQHLESALTKMLALLNRIPEKCDPYIFFHRVRPYLAGWPEPGILYEGVSETPQVYIGGSAAQSPVLQAIDAGLGILHESPQTHAFLTEMRCYMLPAHRQFIEVLEKGSSVRSFVLEQRQSFPRLADQYNACTKLLDAFRQKHMEIAVRYIARQADGAVKGTGGTDFVPLLSQARKETRERLIKRN